MDPLCGPQYLRDLKHLSYRASLPPPSQPQEAAQASRTGRMRFTSLTPAIALAATASALSRNPAHVNKRYLLEKARPATHLETRNAPPSYSSKNESTIIPQNSNTTKFAVDGTAIPDVHFDIGESYAGLLPISDKANASELFFWFVPSANELAGDEILIWLNGGPGCSSMEGFLQENGRFLRLMNPDYVYNADLGTIRTLPLAIRHLPTR